MGNLPPGLAIGDLRDLFAAHGCYLVSIRLATDKMGESKDHALVDLPPGDAQKAIDALDGYVFGGRALKVVQRKVRTAGL